MNHWVFKSNRKKYRLDDRLNDPAQPITWRVTDYRDEIKPGDVAFISQTRNGRGIRAAVKIESYPAAMPDIQAELTYWADRPIVKCRAKGILTRRWKEISFKTLKIRRTALAGDQPSRNRESEATQQVTFLAKTI